MKLQRHLVHNIILLAILFSPLSVVLASSTSEVKLIDKDGDNSADLLLIRDKNFLFSGTLKKAKIVSFSIRKVSSHNLQLTYVSNSNKFDLTYGYATTDKVFKGRTSGNSDACLDSTGPGLQNLEKIGQAETSESLNICTNDFRKIEKISKAVDGIMLQSEDMANCITALDSAAGWSWLYLEDELKNIKLCLGNDREKDSKSCTGTFEAEDKSVIIYSSCLKNSASTKNIIQHELLHAVGILDDRAIECIEKNCPNKEAFSRCIQINDPLAVNSNKSSGPVAITEIPITSSSGTATPAATAQIAANTTIQVPRQIAAASVPQPSPADLRVTGGSRTFTVPSNSNTFPAQMIRFAENAILPTTAFAAQNKSSTLKASPRTIATASKSAGIATTNVKPVNSRGIASAAPAASASAKLESSQTPAPSDATSVTKSGKVTAPTVSANNLAKTSRAAPTGNSSAGTSVTGGAKTSNSSGSRNRATASQSNYSTAELVSILKQDSYPDVKKRLQQDDAFIEALKSNAITIYNTKGEQIGSPSGRIIFSDTGNRFIQGK